MSRLIQNLEQRHRQFDVVAPDTADVSEWFANELLNFPRLAASLSALSYYTLRTPGVRPVLRVSASYEPHALSCPAILVRSAFELVTAVSLYLRLHLPRIKLVIDNRSGLIPETNRFSVIHACEEYVGEDLQIHQQSVSRSRFQSLFQHRVVIYTLETVYFDSAKEVNDLSCLLAEQAARIRRSAGGNTKAMLHAILSWLRQNVEYRKSGRLSDHSAVGLVKNGTAVCQGIAAYVYQLLCFCGVHARYVKGQGFDGDSWGNHGWNMAFVDGRWVHLDFTFELHSRASSLIKPEREFRMDHRWDEALYQPSLSTEILTTKRTLNHSVFQLRPDRPDFSVNGCVVDMAGRSPVCVTLQGVPHVALFDLFSMCGGCFQLKGDTMWLYAGTNQYSVPLSDFTYRDGTWYFPMVRLPQLGFYVQAESLAVSVRRAG